MYAMCRFIYVVADHSITCEGKSSYYQGGLGEIADNTLAQALVISAYTMTVVDGYSHAQASASMVFW
jgi:hypothetical protein